jgi:hypothetical protein
MTLRELIKTILDVTAAIWDGFWNCIGRGVDAILDIEAIKIFYIIVGLIIIVIVISIFDALARRFPKLEKLKLWHVFLIMIIVVMLSEYVATLIRSL